MKDKPIIFSGPMVQAILEGRKTMTRRVMKPAKRNREGYKQGNGLWVDGYGTEDRPNEHIKDYSVSPVWQRKDYYIKDFAPYKPGDTLWVRETWASWCDECDSNQGAGYKDATCAYGDCNRYAYKANDDGCPGGKWRPSIHMPKEAARIWLEVTNVRAERLQEITEEDAIREGIKTDTIRHMSADSRIYEKHVNKDGNVPLAIVDFIGLWNSLNASRGYPFESSPWVWVIEFKRIKP